MSTPLEDRARRLPTGPGVYLFRDDAGRVLYVGKATNLRARVATYLRGRESRPLVHLLMRRATDVDTVVDAHPGGGADPREHAHQEGASALQPAAQGRQVVPARPRRPHARVPAPRPGAEGQAGRRALPGALRRARKVAPPHPALPAHALPAAHLLGPRARGAHAPVPLPPDRTLRRALRRPHRRVRLPRARRRRRRPAARPRRRRCSTACAARWPRPRTRCATSRPRVVRDRLQALESALERQEAVRAGRPRPRRRRRRRRQAASRCSAWSTCATATSSRRAPGRSARASRGAR